MAQSEKFNLIIPRDVSFQNMHFGAEENPPVVRPSQAAVTVVNVLTILHLSRLCLLMLLASKTSQKLETGRLCQK